MGTAVISPRKVARYRVATGLPIIAAYAPAGTHSKLLYLEGGGMAWLGSDGKVEMDTDRWDASNMDKDAATTWLARYFEKVERGARDRMSASDRRVMDNIRAGLTP